MTSEMNTDIGRNISLYIMDGFLLNSDQSNVNGTIQDSSHNFSTKLHSSNSLNKTTDGDSYLDKKICETVYYCYSYELLLAGAVCCILLSIFGITGNFISILALLKKKRLRNATTAFIVNLCVADMLFCSFTMPLTAVTFIEKDWNYGVALCKFFALIKFTNGIVSYFTVVAITVNRYVLIVYPTLHPTIYKKRNIAIFIFCLWMFPLSLIALPLFDVWGTLKYNPNVGDCGVMDLDGKSPRALIFVVAMILPSVLFIACYMKIYFVVKKTVVNSHRMEEPGVLNPRAGDENARCDANEHKTTTVYVFLRDKKEFRVLRIVFVIFVVYILTTFPIALIKLFHKEKELQVMNILAYITYFSASVINPIIYIIMSREYRTAYKDLFKVKCCNMLTVRFVLESWMHSV